MFSRFCVTVVLAAALARGTPAAGQQASRHAAPPRLDAEVRRKLIDSISIALRRNYVWEDTAASMSERLLQQLRRGAYDDITDPPAFAAALTRDLHTVYGDVHLSVAVVPSWHLAERQVASRTSRGATRDGRAPDARRQNFGFTEASVLRDNIGYLRIDHLFDVSRESMSALAAAFGVVRDARALIIDLRGNHGGSPDMVREICNYLFPVRTHLNDLFERRSGITTQYWTTPDNGATTLFSVPVYVLVSHETFSAAEELSYDLQARQRAVIVGETTGGGAHAVWGIPVGHGFVANIPYARAINPVTRTNWERKGVQPDIRIASDRALDAAISATRRR